MIVLCLYFGSEYNAFLLVLGIVGIRRTRASRQRTFIRHSETPSFTIVRIASAGWMGSQRTSRQKRRISILLKFPSTNKNNIIELLLHRVTLSGQSKDKSENFYIVIFAVLSFPFYLTFTNRILLIKSPPFFKCRTGFMVEFQVRGTWCEPNYITGERLAVFASLSVFQYFPSVVFILLLVVSNKFSYPFPLPNFLLPNRQLIGSV